MTNDAKAEVLSKAKEYFAKTLFYFPIEKLVKSAYWVSSAKDYIGKVAFDKDVEITTEEVEEIFNMLVA